jgi:hypothetical protein
MGVASRLALIAGILLLALAAPARAHDSAVADHGDTRAELAAVEVAETVETVESAAGTEGDGLPVTWCGERRTTDGTANAAFDPGLPQFKLVYAYPSDRPNRFAEWADALQADVSLIGRFVGAQSGGLKAPRVDMGTSCGPQYVDLQVVALPGGRASYVDDFDALETAVREKLTHDAGDPRNVVVLADSLSGRSIGRWWAIATSYLDERPGAVNHSNRGNIFSALWVPDGEPSPGADPEGWWPEGMLHEMTHNLGSVQENAPHATLYGHCFDGFDVMCYDDGGSPPQTSECPRIAGVMSQVFDCSGDDYFNPSPPAGSYLATSWNTYDNVFLGGCGELAPACGGTASGAPALPVATSNPAITGLAQPGQRLTGDPGAWLNEPQSYAFRWEREDGAGWARIARADGPEYTVTTADLGKRVRVRVLATNDDGSSAAYSEPTAAVAYPAAAPAPQPSVTGAPLPPPPVQETATAPVDEPAVDLTTPARGRATLKVASRRGRGKRLGTVAFAVASGRLEATPSRVRLARGRYELKLCTTAGASASRPRCARRRLTVKRSGKRRLPVLSVRVPAGSRGRATYTVTAVGRLFTASTARRPAVGVLLRG